MKKILKWAIVCLLYGVCTVLDAQTQPVFDTEKYISLDEIKPGMPAYCLTILQGSKVERFEMKVLSIVPNAMPKRSRILVEGLDERFKKIGAVHGCSGSPLFVDNRLAGALSGGWDGSLESLYLVTPIEDMLEIGTGKPASQPQSSGATKLTQADFAGLSDIQQLGEKMDRLYAQQPHPAIPIMASLCPQTCQLLGEAFEKTGFALLAAPAGGTSSESTTFERGGVLSVPICSGDINMVVTGTVTEVVGDKVYGFGHAFTGTGQLELPMAAGMVHTVVATHATSFKLSSPGPIRGTLRYDQEDGVVGITGVMPKLIDLTVHVKRFDAVQDKTFHCKAAMDRKFTPLVIRTVASEAALNQGALPTEHTLRYRCKMKMENGKMMDFDGLTSGQSIMPMSMELFALSGAMLNNPFEQFSPTAVQIDIEIEPRNILAEIWSIHLASRTVMPGQTLQARVTLKTFRSELTTYPIDITVPQDCPAGKYTLTISGADGYRTFLAKAAPYQFTAVDGPTLMEALKRILTIPSDRLYACLSLTPQGFSLRNTELGDLPASKTGLLASDSRIEPFVPYTRYTQTSIPTDRMVVSTGTVEIVVENP